MGEGERGWLRSWRTELMSHPVALSSYRPWDIMGARVLLLRMLCLVSGCIVSHMESESRKVITICQIASVLYFVRQPLVCKLPTQISTDIQSYNLIQLREPSHIQVRPFSCSFSTRDVFETNNSDDYAVTPDKLDKEVQAS